MIDDALDLLDRPLPSWQEDAPLRRELIALRDDVRAYKIASGYDAAKAARKAAMIRERTDRIHAFMKGHRHSTRERRYWAAMRTPA